MKFFTSPKDLGAWVKEYKTPHDAAENLMAVVGKNEEQDIVQACRSIFDEGDSSGPNVLFEILRKHNVTQKREGSMKDKMIKEAQIIGRDAPLYANMDLKVCPKLPFSVGKRLISTYNCRNQCLDSLVLDDDPNRVYCLEAMWRRHVMDKFAREFKDKDGKWVGGYINERFQTFKDDGGNQMQLAHGERTRKPRPHQFSTERRLEEARGEKTTDLTASSNKFVKLAAVDTKEVVDDTFKMFDDIIEMKQAGLNDEDIIMKVAEHYNTTILKVAGIHKAASKMLGAHNGTVYSHSCSTMKKTAIVGKPNASYQAMSQIDNIDITLADGKTAKLPMGTIVTAEPNAQGGKTVFTMQNGTKFTLTNDSMENQVFGLVEEAIQNDNMGSLPHIPKTDPDMVETMKDSGLLEEVEPVVTASQDDDFSINVES